VITHHDQANQPTSPPTQSNNTQPHRVSVSCAGTASHWALHPRCGAQALLYPCLTSSSLQQRCVHTRMCMWLVEAERFRFAGRCCGWGRKGAARPLFISLDALSVGLRTHTLHPHHDHHDHHHHPGTQETMRALLLYLEEKYPQVGGRLGGWLWTFVV